VHINPDPLLNGQSMGFLYLKFDYQPQKTGFVGWKIIIWQFL
jgi:hypothetical protein